MEPRKSKISVPISFPSTASALKVKAAKFLWPKRRSQTLTITEYDPMYKVVYLGNVLTMWAGKSDGCVDKPLATLWKNYCSTSKPGTQMRLSLCNSGLKGLTKEHGLTEYWSNRITFCTGHPQYPRVFCWVYRHEGKKMKQELRCHAVLCSKEDKVKAMVQQLTQKLTLALQEFKREKLSRQKARLSLANCCYNHPSLPRRKILLSTGSMNFKPPLDRSRSAPRLMSIEESNEDDLEEEDEQDQEDDLEDEGLMNSSMNSESTSDIVPDDYNLGDHFIIYESNPDGGGDDDGVNVDDPDSPTSTQRALARRIQRAKLGAIDEGTSEAIADNVSDESGYSEETKESGQNIVKLKV